MSNFEGYRATVLNFLLGDINITALVDDRIYPQELATLPEHDYPCITFRPTRGEEGSFVWQKFPVIFGAHSSVSMDEAMAVYQLLTARLVAGQAGIGFVFFPSGTPLPGFVPSDLLYSVFCRFTCWRIGL